MEENVRGGGSFTSKKSLDYSSPGFKVPKDQASGRKTLKTPTKQFINLVDATSPKNAKTEEKEKTGKA